MSLKNKLKSFIKKQVTNNEVFIFVSSLQAGPVCQLAYFTYFRILHKIGYMWHNSSLVLSPCWLLKPIYMFSIETIERHTNLIISFELFLNYFNFTNVLKVKGSQLYRCTCFWIYFSQLINIRIIQPFLDFIFK